VKPAKSTLTPKESPKTTVTVEGPLHDRLLRAAAKTRLSKADVLRLCADVGLPQIEHKFAEMRGESGVADVGLALRVKPEQLVELRELYKSAVTDIVSGVEKLDGLEFVKAVEAALDSNREAASQLAAVAYEARDEARVRRFLAVYAQLF
jgi:hypothetical protein